MATDVTKLSTVIDEAYRFIRRAQAARKRLQLDKDAEQNALIGVGVKEVAAARRASLDLTRALADMRRT